MISQLITIFVCINVLFECRIKGPAETVITSHMNNKGHIQSVSNAYSSFCISIYEPMSDLKLLIYLNSQTINTIKYFAFSPIKYSSTSSVDKIVLKVVLRLSTTFAPVLQHGRIATIVICLHTLRRASTRQLNRF